MYRVGFPGWKLLARVGVPLYLRVDVHHDTESDSYWADSPDMDGLVAGGDTLEGLFEGINDCVGMLLEDALRQTPKSRPMTAWTGEILPA